STGGRADFLGVAGANGGECARELDAAFEENNAAVGLDAVDGETLRRQAKLGEDRRRKLSLEREIVDGEDRTRSGTAGEAEISGGERRLPVVGMDDRWCERRHDAAA